MIQSAFLILFVVCAVLAAGCGSSEEGTNSNVNSANTVNTAPNMHNNVNRSKANMIANANSLANNSATPAISQPVSKDAKPLSQPAPDNSEVVISLAENVVRTRTFKNHPQILKVEETTLIQENNRKVIRVYLKNGSTKEIPEGKINDAMTETAANILKAAG